MNKKLFSKWAANAPGNICPNKQNSLFYSSVVGWFFVGCLCVKFQVCFFSCGFLLNASLTAKWVSGRKCMHLPGAAPGVNRSGRTFKVSHFIQPVTVTVMPKGETPATAFVGILRQITIIKDTCAFGQHFH